MEIILFVYILSLLPVMLLMAKDWPMNIDITTKRQMRCTFPLILMGTNDLPGL